MIAAGAETWWCGCGRSGPTAAGTVDCAEAACPTRLFLDHRTKRKASTSARAPTRPQTEISGSARTLAQPATQTA